jgi:hypothetical protein
VSLIISIIIIIIVHIINSYSYHERMSCLYTSDPTTGHSTRIGAAGDGNGIYGMYNSGVRVRPVRARLPLLRRQRVQRRRANQSTGLLGTRRHG